LKFCILRSFQTRPNEKLLFTYFGKQRVVTAHRYAFCRSSAERTLAKTNNLQEIWLENCGKREGSF
jgi:hypothetical protein